VSAENFSNTTAPSPAADPEVDGGLQQELASNNGQLPEARATGVDDPTAGPGDDGPALEVAASTRADGRATGKDADDGPATLKLLDEARRGRDLKKKARAGGRQLDIELRNTPISEVFFRAWADEDDYAQVSVLKSKSDGNRTEVYVLSPAVLDLPRVAAKAVDVTLVPCITSTGQIFVWAVTESASATRFSKKQCEALERVLEAARRDWVMISWENGLRIHDPDPDEPLEDPATWPTRQGPGEMIELAISGAYIQDV
jgi:hypothetical protein